MPNLILKTDPTTKLNPYLIPLLQVGVLNGKKTVARWTLDQQPHCKQEEQVRTNRQETECRQNI